MNKNNKKMYMTPTIEEHVVELEQGIAAGSNLGNPSTNPDIDDWGNGGGGEGNGDL